MFSALWLMRLAAFAVRLNNDTLTIPATITTATTIVLVSATAPRSRSTNVPTPLFRPDAAMVLGHSGTGLTSAVDMERELTTP
jgi:hypothetical protein